MTIRQKTARHTPPEKLLDAFAAILAGRQMGPVIATTPEEIVADRLYPSNLHLNNVIHSLFDDM